MIKVHLAGLYSRPYVVQSDDMKLHLAGLCFYGKDMKDDQLKQKKLCILESFHYFQDWMVEFLPTWDFMLDSGAFTFLNEASKKNDDQLPEIDWDEYVDRYCEFIIKHDIDLFFELDIDSLVGYDEVKRLRAIIEDRTRKRCIPVWHLSRGEKEWHALVKEYGYVSIGGIVTREITRDKYKYFNPLIDIAHKNDCKVHGLGFTPMNLKDYRFDSVDSTAWTYGNRSGHVFRFNGSGLDKISVPEKKQLKAKQAAMHNFKQWVLYQNYLRLR